MFKQPRNISEHIAEIQMQKMYCRGKMVMAMRKTDKGQTKCTRTMHA